MEAWIILVQVNPDLDAIRDLQDIAICYSDGALHVFKSFDDAYAFKEENEIDGQVIELPLA